MRKLAIACAALLVLAGCTTGSPQGDRAVVGGGVGAATGALIGGLATGTGGGALIGAGIGGAGGALIGAGTTPQCQVYDRRGRPLVDQYGDPITRTCRGY